MNQRKPAAWIALNYIRTGTGDIFRGKARTQGHSPTYHPVLSARHSHRLTSGGVAVVKSPVNIKVILDEGDSFGEGDYLWQQSLHRRRFSAG